MVSSPCGACGEPIFPGVRSCPHCGSPNRLDPRALAKSFLPVLGTAAGLALLTVLCSPATKNLTCAYQKSSQNRSDADPYEVVDPGLENIERFSIDFGTKQVVFPGSKEIQSEKASYILKGNQLTFVDRLGNKYVLNLNSGGLQVFANPGQQGQYTFSAAATCTGL